MTKDVEVQLEVLLAEASAVEAEVEELVREFDLPERASGPEKRVSTPRGTIPERVLKALALGEVEGNVFRIRERLARDLYDETQKVLKALGGDWKGGKVSGHVFPEDPAELIEDALQTCSYKRVDRNPLEFYRTPDELAIWKCRMAEIRRGSRVLEPSAGEGGIARHAAEIASYATTTVVEVDRGRWARLKEMGFRRAYCYDFLEGRLKSDYFDAVVMNPPFRHEADIKHVYEAYRCLRPGGILVSTMSGGTAYRPTNRCKEFREWLKPRTVLPDIYIENEPGTFAFGTIEIAVRKSL